MTWPEALVACIGIVTAGATFVGVVWAMTRF